MRLDITTSGDFSDTINWLNRAKNRIPDSALNKIGKQGVSALKAATPKDSGLTASGWDYTITRNRRGAELGFVNNAHPGESVNLARIIQFGHGTGTGGYVPPRDYINPALKGVFSTAGDLIAKEMFR